MQLWQLTTAVVAGSEPPRQWPLLGVPSREIFGLGVLAGVMVVALARGWLRWRAPRRVRRADASAARQVPESASAPVSVAIEPAVRPAVPVAVVARPAIGPAEPDLVTSRAADQPRPASLRVGVLGQLTINGQPGALLPAQTQLIVALALHGETGLLGKQLCELLGSDADHPKPADSLRQLIARTRRQLGRADDSSEWIVHLGRGRYALHKETRVDWHEFDRLTDQGIRAGDAGQLSAALAMIRGQPFTGCFYWWLDIELIDVVSTKIVTAATSLAELALSKRDPAAAARAARIGLMADATSEQLWRQLMRAEHAAGNLAGVREAWSRCVDAVAEIAVDGEPEPATAALYDQLLDHGLLDRGAC